MDGLLLIDKPQGITSHDVVYAVRRATKIKQVGHSGTLDPMATGLLVVCVGNATRLSEYLLDDDKAYVGSIQLGQRTNTDDAEGEVMETRPVPDISPAQLETVRQHFLGEIQQVPPQFSAIKKEGQRAYALARQGEHVELAARTVKIYDLRLTLDQSRAILRAEISCGSGTYIRSLARDMGEMLGCGGHLVALRRVQASGFLVDDALTLEQLDEWQQKLKPMDAAVNHMPSIVLNNAQTQRVMNGNFVEMPAALASNTLHRVYNPQQELIAIAQSEGTKLQPLKVLAMRHA